MYKKANIVMLPSNEKAHFGDIILTPYTKKLLIFQYRNCIEVAQHLYITSDEEIKEDDYTIYCGIYLCKIISNKMGIIKSLFIKDGIIKEVLVPQHKKIIATTDVLPIYKAGIEIGLFIPKLSKEFIEAYIKTYNKGKQITTVEIEYESMDISTMTSDTKTHPNLSIETLKVNPDNTINIKPIKDSWNREEVIELLNKFAYDVSGNGMLVTAQLKVNEFWIEENL